jgi:adenine C2-methylase RlmN of 23S rRNA A2503 and tRNA A37
MTANSSGMTANSMPIKRHRDPLFPKPILDRIAFLKSLQSNGVLLKNGQLDLFYQLLHRSGYPPLREFITELVQNGEGGDVISYNDENKEDNSVLPSNHHHHIVASKFRTKNAVSSRPGRTRPQFPKSFLAYLANNIEEYGTLTSRVQVYKTSVDGSTTKIAVELQDGHVVESVLMRHEGRVTICVSSQVGCAMGCTFCATGTMGIRGNLSSGEILEQLVHGSRILASSSSSSSSSSTMETPDDGRLGTDVVTVAENGDGKQKRPLDLIRNVVFMGMGEPLNNYTNVLAACRAMIDRRLWNLANNHVTVSTVGVPSRMRDLSRDLPEVNLALSLHAPNQSMREKIVPAARGTPIESLIEALDEHMMALVKRKLVIGSGVVDETNTAAFTEFSSDERQSASKKKRAMIEYVMCECNIIWFDTLLLTYHSHTHEIQWRVTHPQSKRLTNSVSSVKDVIL